jgi:hypothetical protein
MVPTAVTVGKKSFHPSELPGFVHSWTVAPMPKLTMRTMGMRATVLRTRAIVEGRFDGDRRAGVRVRW